MKPPVVGPKLAVVVTLRRVPRVVAGRPRQVDTERREEVVERPRDDHVVKEVRIEGDQHDRASDAWGHMQAKGRLRTTISHLLKILVS